MKLGADDANRLLALIGRLHDAGTTEEIAVTCREGLAHFVPADLYDLVVLAGGPPQDDRYLGTPGGYTAAEIEAVLAVGFEHPVVAHYVTHGDCGPCSVSDVLPLDRWRDTAFYALATGGFVRTTRSRRICPVVRQRVWPASRCHGPIVISTTASARFSDTCAVLSPWCCAVRSIARSARTRFPSTP